MQVYIRNKNRNQFIYSNQANFNTPVSDQIMNYKFSPIETAQRPELFESHRRHMVNVMNMQNVAQLFAEYERRTDIPVYRPYDPKLFNQTTLRCETLVMVGDLSPFLDSSVEVNSRLNPQKTTFLKILILNLLPNSTRNPQPPPPLLLPSSSAASLICLNIWWSNENTHSFWELQYLSRVAIVNWTERSCCLKSLCTKQHKFISIFNKKSFESHYASYFRLLNLFLI